LVDWPGIDWLVDLEIALEVMRIYQNGL
jgi:hypothetical protein